jgi:glycosyltransferase involved in cell wall biosynthesis
MAIYLVWRDAAASGPISAARLSDEIPWIIQVGEVELSQKRILIISYLFPPAGGIGVQRALSFAKYLPQCGFDVYILKAGRAGGPVQDPDLLRQVPGAVKVYEAFTPEIPFSIRERLWSRLQERKPAVSNPNAAGFSWKRALSGAAKRIMCPEPEILWVPFALRKARRIIRRHQIDVVLVTVPPFSALVAGSTLKREFSSLALVSDFRDEWLSFYLKDFDFQRSDFTRRRAEVIEREAVERSDLVVAVNRSSRDEIRRRYPYQPDSKFVVVPNGYDPQVFTSVSPRAHRLTRMIVTHVGTVYKTASPRFYLNAVDGLPESIRDSLETRFVGRIAETERPWMQGRRSAVSLIGFRPQAEALNFMVSTDFLLLTMTNEISVPGKLFEYFAVGKPILAITPPGSEVDQILHETGSGITAHPDSVADIQAMLIRAFEAWRDEKPLLQGPFGPVERYQRPRLVEEYAALIRNCGIRG